MRAVILLLTSALTTFAAGANEPQVLRLDIVCGFGTRSEQQMKSGVHILRVRSSVTNIGTQPVIVPTTTFDGQPHMVVTGQTHLDVHFRVGFEHMDHRRMTPSPVRFFPVLLQPGESTELAMYEEPIMHPELIRKVLVEFEVEEDYARPEKWWYGAVQKEIDVKLGEPNPEATPDQRPPAAPSPSPGAPHL